VAFNGTAATAAVPLPDTATTIVIKGIGR
jgi:hypothetical protein